ncbi:sensor histidine kinase [Streptomyces hydrogenans]|uniref:sensor histidine kinase n=1 Tax=Streptomyces hydrogenans TaxID=1873719 RepID=UPI0038241935
MPATAASRATPARERTSPVSAPLASSRARSRSEGRLTATVLGLAGPRRHRAERRGGTGRRSAGRPGPRHHAARPRPVAGDPALLAQVAANLLANAVRHNHPGGTAALTTGTIGERTFLDVTNSGPVLEQRDIPGLFEPFRRGQGRPGNGLGLGLAVVRAITHSHDGTITATARPGGGITVHLDLPRRTEPRPPR